jgi:hypothetical protein
MTNSLMHGMHTHIAEKEELQSGRAAKSATGVHYHNDQGCLTAMHKPGIAVRPQDTVSCQVGTATGGRQRHVLATVVTVTGNVAADALLQTTAAWPQPLG